jgi:uncharacterized protein (DUF1684 family)
MKRTTSLIIVILVFGFVLLGDRIDPDLKAARYLKQINAWHAKRIARLKAKGGWLSLIGLFWLEEGNNTMGSADTNDFVVEAQGMPSSVGTFNFKQGVVVFRTNSKVKHKGKVVEEIVLQDDSKKEYTLLEFDSFTWYIIKRGSKYGVRIKNNEDPKIAALKDIDMFKIDPKWAVKAKYIKFDKAKTIKVLDAIGQVTEATIFGKLVFSKDGKGYELFPLGEVRGFFLVFGDQTNQHETYGGGRFLYIPKPDENGETIIDFNKAFNPPCVFSSYATCPMPIKKNILQIRIAAGEKMYGNSH